VPLTPGHEALRTAAAIGPYFAWEPWDGGDGWRPLTELLDADVVAERVGVARRTLVRMSGLSPDEIGEREVASIAFLGWASRLVSPLLGAVALTGVLPRVGIGHLRWRAVEGGPLPIAFDSDAVEAGEEFDLGTAGALLAVVSARFSLPEHLLWGNVASALGGAAGMIADSRPEGAGGAAGFADSTSERAGRVAGFADSTSERAGRIAGFADSTSECAGRAAAVVEELLARAPLDGTATLERPDPERARWFLVRRNCCLYYRIPGGGTCGDCVLTPDEVRRQHWQAVLSR
jgi:hypothetical protein